MAKPWSGPGLSLRGGGLLAAIVALACQLASGTFIVDRRALGDTAGLLRAVIVCEAGSRTPLHGPKKPGSHGSDQGIVSLVASLSLPSPTLPPDAHLPVPAPGVPDGPAMVPAARAPPACRSCAALPRGPPALI